MLPAILLSSAAFAALFVQLSTSWLAGAWLPLMLFGCVSAYNPKNNGGLMWWASLAWLLSIVGSVFFINPVMQGAYTMWVLSALPIVALSLPAENIKPCMMGVLGVLVVFALGLIAQMLIHVQPSLYGTLVHVSYRSGYAYAWPMIDPNNAACVLNFGLISCFWLGLKDKRWFAVVAIFAFAHISCASKAGALAAIISCSVLLIERYRLIGTLAVLLCLAACIELLFCPIEWITQYLGERPEMWAACLQMIKMHPWVGFGAGSFPFYYSQFRTEHINGGFYAHNDILQFAVELGVPVSIVFILLAAMVAICTRRANIVSGAVFLCTFIQSMVEFQFYVPVISILAGLTLAYHRLTYCGNRNIMSLGENHEHTVKF